MSLLEYGFLAENAYKNTLEETQKYAMIMKKKNEKLGKIYVQSFVLMIQHHLVVICPRLSLSEAVQLVKERNCVIFILKTINIFE